MALEVNGAGDLIVCGIERASIDEASMERGLMGLKRGNGKIGDLLSAGRVGGIKRPAIERAAED